MVKEINTRSGWKFEVFVKIMAGWPQGSIESRAIGKCPLADEDALCESFPTLESFSPGTFESYAILTAEQSLIDRTSRAKTLQVATVPTQH